MGEERGEALLAEFRQPTPAHHMDQFWQFCRRDSGPMLAMLVQFWQPDSAQCMRAGSGLSFIPGTGQGPATGLGPSNFFRHAGFGPALDQTNLATWVNIVKL